MQVCRWLWTVCTTGTPARPAARTTDIETSGYGLCRCRTSGRSSCSSLSTSRTAVRECTGDGAAASLPASDMAASSSLVRRYVVTLCPAARKAWISWSTTTFSPEGLVDR